MSDITLRLVNYELEKKNYNIRIDPNFFNDFFSDFKNADSFKQEILSSLHDYYYFLNYDDSKTNFDLIFQSIKNLFEGVISKSEQFRILKDNDPLLFSVWYFYGKDLDLVVSFYTILIMKGFLSTKEGSNFENSDVILNQISKLFESFLVFFYNDLDSTLNYKELRIHFFVLIEYLIKMGALRSKLIWVKKDDSLISEKFWGLINWKKNYIPKSFNIFYTVPTLQMINRKSFLVGGYYSKVFLIFKKNLNSDLIFELNDEKYLKELTELKWFIDIGWFGEILKIINKDYKKLRDDLDQLISELDLCDWSNQNLQKAYSYLTNQLTLFDFYYWLLKIKLRSPVYFPFYFDFRGRLYYDSVVGITSCKLLRSIYYYGYYEERDFLEEVDFRFYNLIIKYEEELNFIQRWYNFENPPAKVRVNFLFVLIGIGRILVRKNKVKIHMNEFVSEGLKAIVDNFSSISKVEDLVEVRSLENIIINWKDNAKRTISKDFTASFFQHLTRLLGAKSRRTMELANMCDDLNWHDTYSFIIDEFLKKNEKLENSLLFTRSLLKKTIMTIPYSIGNNAAWKYFMEGVLEESHRTKTLRKEYNLFFNFAKSLLDGTELFLHSTDRMVLCAITQSRWLRNFNIKMGKSSVNLIYFKSKKKVIDLTIRINKNTMRITKKINVIDYGNVDYEGVAISVRANWIAMMDGEILRKISTLMNRKMFTIHDCLLVDWLSTDNLILACNASLENNEMEGISWNNTNNFAVFSFFIIL